MFGTLGGPELFLIFVVALIIFGPRKLPEIGKSLGRMMAEFRKASNEFRSTIESEVEAERIRDAMRIEAPRLDAPTTAPPGSTGPATPTATAEGGSEAATDESVPAAATPPAETVERQPSAASGEPR